MYESAKYYIIEITNGKGSTKSMVKLDAALKKTIMNIRQSDSYPRPDLNEMAEIIKGHAEALNFSKISVEHDDDHVSYLCGIEYDIFRCTFGKFECKIHIAR